MSFRKKYEELLQALEDFIVVQRNDGIIDECLPQDETENSVSYDIVVNGKKLELQVIDPEE